MGDKAAKIVLNGVGKTYRTRRPRNTFLERMLPSRRDEYLEVQALDDLSLSVSEGRFVAIIGPSGCGKTTALRMMDGLVTADAGSVFVNGTPVTGPRRECGFVFQDFGLYPWRTVVDNVAFGLEMRGVGREERYAQAAPIIDLVGLRGFERTYPHQLSGGMQQRVMIAMALSAGPDLIIADEPTSSLDVTIQSQILDLLVKLQQDLGVTIMMITHDLGIVAETCEQMAVFYLGRIIEQGAVGNIFHDTKHPYTQGLLAALPNPQNWEDKLKVIPGTVPTLLEAIQGCAFAPRCEYVMSACTKKNPPLIQFNSTHRAACHLYTNGNTAGVV